MAHSVNASAYNKGYAVFLRPVSKELDVSRAAISLVFSLSRSQGGPISPVAGSLINRLGPKPILLIGAHISRPYRVGEAPKAVPQRALSGPDLKEGWLLEVAANYRQGVQP